ncbi:MAG: hypothetical protein IK025_03725 [Bacteroidales bacterium]|nr:hypothetical protein [Bacteroidales bacterium]
MSQDLLVCGNSVDLSANIENYSSFSWFCDGVNGTFSNAHSLITTFTLANDVNLQSFLDVRFYYNANVGGEIVSDTINVCFIKQPRAVISMYEGDTLVCGLVTPFLLHADEHGDEISGYWYEENPSTAFGAVNSTNTDATVTSYGNHNFYWVECNGSDDNPQYCKDTAGPWTIHFVRNPLAQINQDEMTFCGYDGQLHADFNGVGIGRWSTNVPNQNILAIDDRSNPTTMIHTTILNRDNPSYPYYEIYWTVQNTEYCTDKDTVKVVFAGVPSESIVVVPPVCFGGPAILTAHDETLPVYNWNYGAGVLDSVETNSLGGEYRIFVHWEDYLNEHTVDLTTINSWGCYSYLGRTNINEPNTGKIEARFMISADIDVNNLVAPDAHIYMRTQQITEVQ